MLTPTMGEDGAEARSRSYFGSGAAPGEVIAGRYRVVRELGAGGMGQVVEAEHVELEKSFALKLIRPDRWDATLEARFRREARALARVSTPRVAQVTDFGVDDDRGPFYVMELVEGEPLDDLIRREGPLGRERALELGIGIAEALADVHDAGIIHRDVKPGNIGVCHKGPVEVRLLDFGLATSADERFGSRITESKRVVGSMPYMAPEQFHGEAPTPAVDLWALGIVVYEMLSGQLPFDAPTTAALIQKILNETPPPLPQGRVAGPLSRLLAKEPSLRPQTAQEVMELLEDAIANPDQTDGSVATAEATRIDRPATAAARKPWPRSVGVGLAAVGLITIGAAVGTWLTTADAEPVSIELSADPDPLAGAEPESIPEAEPESIPDPEPDPDPIPEPDPPPDPDDDPDPIPEPVPDPEPTPDSDPEPARARRRAAPPAPEPDAPEPDAVPSAEEEPADAWDGTIIESPSP